MVLCVMSGLWVGLGDLLVMAFGRFVPRNKISQCVFNMMLIAVIFLRSSIFKILVVFR